MKRKDLIALIQRIVREECGELLDTHLSDYIHIEKPFKPEWEGGP